MNRQDGNLLIYNDDLKSLQVVAINGQTVGPGIEGELRVKTDSMMAKYVGYPEDTSRAFDLQGWFRTGDIGYYDENGFVYALGRLSDFIHYKNTRVSKYSNNWNKFKRLSLK